MLGKLIKHELRAVSRFLLPIHLLLLAACFLGRLVFQTSTRMDIPKVVLIISLIFFFSILVLVPCVTSILIVVRYYKSLYTDEGYLTLTLPATRGQLLFSKGFVACLWSILDLFIVIAGCAIIILVPAVTEQSSKILFEFEKALEMSPIQFFWTTVGLSIVGCFGNIALYFFSVSIGQLLSSHRVLGAVVAYFTISTVVSMVMMIVLFSTGYNPFINMYAASHASNPLFTTYKSSAFAAIAEAVIFFIGTYYLLKKKTNLS